jgi:hypothetical protein
MARAAILRVTGWFSQTQPRLRHNGQFINLINPKRAGPAPNIAGIPRALTAQLGGFRPPIAFRFLFSSLIDGKDVPIKRALFWTEIFERFKATAARFALAREAMSVFRRSTSASVQTLFNRRIGFSKGARRTGSMRRA